MSSGYLNDNLEGLYIYICIYIYILVYNGLYSNNDNLNISMIRE